MSARAMGPIRQTGPTATYRELRQVTVRIGFILRLVLRLDLPVVTVRQNGERPQHAWPSAWNGIQVVLRSI